MSISLKLSRFSISHTGKFVLLNDKFVTEGIILFRSVGCPPTEPPQKVLTCI